MNDTKIEPALSAEEWSEVREPGVIRENGGLVYELSYIGWLSTERRIPASVAILNAALPDSDPRKITRETIAALDWVLKQAGGTGDWLHSVEDKLKPIRDALESYLPPR